MRSISPQKASHGILMCLYRQRLARSNRVCREGKRQECAASTRSPEQTSRSVSDTQRLSVVCVVVLLQLSLDEAISQPTIQKIVQAVRAGDVITVDGILSESVWHTPALNWTFTPKLSLQMYIQPLISVGTYTAIKELTRPRSYEFLTYGSGVSTIRKENNEYVIDPDGTVPAQPFSIADPDFNFKSLRGSAVLRWSICPARPSISAGHSSARMSLTRVRSDSDGTSRSSYVPSLTTSFSSN